MSRNGTLFISTKKSILQYLSEYVYIIYVNIYLQEMSCLTCNLTGRRKSVVYMFICHNTAFNIHQLDHKMKLEFCFLLEDISCNYFQPLDEQTVDFLLSH